MSAGLGNINELESGIRFVNISATPTGNLPCDKWKILTVQVSGLGAETVTLNGSVDGVAYSAIRPIDAGTGAVAAASAVGNGIYRYVDCGFAWFNITKSAAAETVTISISGRAF
jgi:hypothetical protein